MDESPTYACYEGECWQWAVMSGCAYLDGSIRNHLGCDLCDILLAQKVFRTLALCVRIVPPVNAVSLGSSLVAEQLKCNLGMAGWFRARCGYYWVDETYPHEHMAPEEATPNVLLIPSCSFVIQKGRPIFSDQCPA